MKNRSFLSFLVLIFLLALNGSCSSDDGGVRPDEDGTPDNGAQAGEVEVSVLLPEGSTIDLSKAKLVSLGSESDMESDGQGELPYNSGNLELGYLMDSENNVLLLGFLSEHRKEISIRTTTEAMLYFGLDYYLLEPSIKQLFLDRVTALDGFDGLVDQMEELFLSDELMYQNGDYIPVLDAKLAELAAGAADRSTDRLFMYGEASKSGLTVLKLDSVHVDIQNILPRRTKAFIYKKSIFDRSGALIEFPDYTDSPFLTLDLEPGKENQITELEVGSSLSRVISQNASVENASNTGAIALPVNPSSEFLAEYELMVVGAGAPDSRARTMTERETQAYRVLSEKTYVLDYFLPTLLEIGGNRAMLPPFGSGMEDELYQAVSPVLQEYGDVLDLVYENDFKAATKAFLPALYGDIRLSDDLRGLLLGVYDVLRKGSNAPQAFVQSHELIETGYPRTKFILGAVEKNISSKNHYKNFGDLKTGANNRELWSISSIDAVVNLGPENSSLCLGEAMELWVTATTAYDPEVEELEYHWSSDNSFKGRIQDIHDDPNNFGASIITKGKIVSYISAALESELGSGDNLETVTVTVYARNLQNGELTKVGEDSMQVNHQQKCSSFYVPFDRVVNIAEEENSLACSGNTMYNVQQATYVAEFPAVENAVGYKARTLRKDGSYTELYDIRIGDNQSETIRFTMGVGGIYIFMTCNLAEAEEEQARRMDYLEEVGSQGIEVFPQFQ